MAEKNINYKKLCVRKSRGRDIYPKTIPQERGHVATYAAAIFCAILFVTDIIVDNSSFWKLLTQYCLGILFAIFLQILHRSILILEERNHVNSRYNGSIVTLLEHAFHFQMTVWIIFGLCMIYCVSDLSSNWIVFDHLDTFKLVRFVTTIYLLGILVKLESGPFTDSLWVAANNGLDYGSGMAYSFFYGYLNLVLPKAGQEHKDLKEIMQDYESRNGIQFATYKLFILIPKSMKCFDSLQNDYFPSIEESSSLEAKSITIAGVKDRSYKNAVYKIISENFDRGYIYVSAEYATPLKTFKNVFKTTGEHSDYYKKYKKDIILQFYLTLRKVLKKEGLDDFCELIYYEDSYETNDVTFYYDVGKIIQDRIRELKKYQ